MRIDLHTHSSASDGTDRPGDLVRHARAAGLDVVALTDHDTTSGWAEAAVTAIEESITLVRGIEISTTYQGHSVHLLAYLPDPEHPGLVAELDAVIGHRNSRVPAICARLAALGIDVTEADVRRAAGPAAAAGRPHVADALVAAGVVRDRQQAFAELLMPGRPAYVHREAASLIEAMAHVHGAGGVTVLAHPWGRGSRPVLEADDLADLAALGLSGIEVDHQDHYESQRAELRDLAAHLGLVATGSSDHHGAGKVDHDLGVNTTAPQEFEDLMARAAASALAATGAGAHPAPVIWA